MPVFWKRYYTEAPSQSPNSVDSLILIGSTCLQVPQVKADDAALQNIELRDALAKGEEETKSLREQVRALSDTLHALSRSAPLSPTSPLLSPRILRFSGIENVQDASITNSSISQQQQQSSNNVNDISTNATFVIHQSNDNDNDNDNNDTSS